MQKTLLLGVILAFHLSVFAQIDDRDEQARIVKNAIGDIAAKPKAKVEIVTHELRRLKGRIEGVYENHFVILPDGQKKPLITIGIPYRPKKYNIAFRDVLQLEAKQLALSFVPDPNRQPFASWDKLSSLGVGVLLQVDLNDGKRTYGVFLSSNQDLLTLIRGNTQTEISKDSVTRIYMITGDTSSIAIKLLGGAMKGSDVTDAIIQPIGDPTPLARGTGSAIGAFIYILPKGGTTRVLVFAK